MEITIHDLYIYISTILFLVITVLWNGRGVANLIFKVLFLALSINGVFLTLVELGFLTISGIDPSSR